MTPCPACRAAWAIAGRRACRRHRDDPARPVFVCACGRTDHHAGGKCGRCYRREYMRSYMRKRRASEGG